MKREELVDLNAFLMIADEGSFTRAAARLGTSQSALSYTINRLEARLGVRLLTRTTRRVSATEAGERLLRTLRPALHDIATGLAAVGDLRDKPAGTIRLTATDHAARTILWPVIRRILPAYPDITIELSVSSALTDIVAERFDAGVRFGEQVARDMVAVRVGPDVRFALVGSPAYFQDHARPETPQDLAGHRCINFRLQTAGGLYAWELAHDGRESRVRVDGPLVVNDARLLVQAALDGLGLSFVMEDEVMAALAEGRLIRVLEPWCAPFAGYHLYYPSRRQPSAAFALLVDALRYRGS
ncbi:MAG TPA: LysR family transcriptional regulator [Acidisoma sp.]|jgi:DNA-binding transcriptional LysR family regulator|nr:LysR family transcriptional regulator [Acidisoma sp.]